MSDIHRDLILAARKAVRCWRKDHAVKTIAVAVLLNNEELMQQQGPFSRHMSDVIARQNEKAFNLLMSGED
jgi:hypothetical protein